MKPISILTLVLCAVLTACSPSSPPRKTPGQEAADKRHQKAVELFSERCKTAGEKIHRTVDNVDGIFLMKIRPDKINFSDQFEMDDPYGSDLGGDAYIKSFLRGSYEANITGGAVPPPKGYRYVEAIDPQDGKRYRYTGRIDEPWKYDDKYSKHYKRFVLDKIPATGPQPRYGVTYDDLSTREEREYWIAGSSLKVIDLKINEIIAERIGYMMDPGQGSLGAGSGRSPWLLAANHACPEFAPRHGSTAQIRQTQFFVGKALHPIKEH